MMNEHIKRIVFPVLNIKRVLSPRLRFDYT